MVDENFHVAISEISNSGERAQEHRRALGLKTEDQDFGYVLTDLVLDDIDQARKTGSGGQMCNYVLITNGDNLYSRNFFEATRPLRQQATSLIGVFMVSHHEWPASSSVIERAGRDVLMRSSFKVEAVDLGAVLWKFSATFGAHSDLRFSLNRNMKDHANDVPKSFWTADGNTIQSAVKKKGTTYSVVPRVLFVHQ